MTRPNITAALDDYIESVTEDRLPDGRYHPSSMFLCDRKVMYEIRGTPVTNPVDAKSKRRFYIGHRLHEAVQRAVELTEDVTAFWPEFELDYEGENIKGAGDGLVFMADPGGDPSDEEVYILEIKSTKKIAVKFGLPKEEHKKQARTYAWAVKHKGVWVKDPYAGITTPTFLGPLGDKVKGVIMVYLDKEELETYEYFLEYEDSWDDDIAEKLNELDVYREDPLSLPPRLPLTTRGTKQWPCNYCPWKDKCWKVDPSYILPADPL